MSENGHLVSSLTETRWRPSRSGLINFYRYDNQEFHFHEGRLLLRGNNGTGKSRVLALQLPFLLDGEISPERVEPDGDKAKRFEWNLLMGKYDDRLGYTWIEFERTGPDGMIQHLTLGCGVRASAGRGVVGKWFFTTGRRVGYDLSLCSSQNNPLPKDSLAEALGAAGRLFTTASAYREEVNRQLYGLPQERYEALIKLLIELRQPKLSRHLDEQQLSSAMSDSLPPVSPRMIQQVGEAMRAMEQDRHALADLQSARQSTDAFLLEYRRYAQIIACRRSENVRAAHNACENRHRKLREAEGEHSAAIQSAKTLRSLDEQLSLNMAAARGRKTTLESSPQMRSARELENSRKLAEERETEANRLSVEHSRSIIAFNDATADHARENERAQRAGERLIQNSNESNRAAEACELGKSHQAAVARAALPQPMDLLLIDAVERLLNKTCDERRAGARVLRELNAEVEGSRQVWKSALDGRDAQAGRAAESITAHHTCEQAMATAAHDLSTAYDQWFRSLMLLTLPPPEDVSPLIPLWMEEHIANAGPVRSIVESALKEFHQNSAAERAAKTVELKAHEQSFQMLAEERDRLLSGQNQLPPAPYTRDPASRHDRTGAPLWQLCEFVEGVPDKDRAAIEAALESAGLLDAWVNPNGDVETPAAFDTFLHEGGASIAGAGLLEVLHPCGVQTQVSSSVPAEVVNNILRRIGLGEGTGPAWVDTTGRWQIGLLSGRWAKTTAQHIGMLAREAERLRRLHDIETRMDETKRSIATVLQAIDGIDERSRLANAEASRAPSEEGVRNAVAERDAHQRLLNQARLGLEEAEAICVRANEALRHKINLRDASASDLGLSNWIERVQLLEDALNDYRQSLVVLWSAAREYLRAAQSAAGSKLRLDREQDRSDRLGEASREAAEKSAAAASQFQTLLQNIGAAVEEVHQKLREAESWIEQIDIEQKRNAGAIGANEQAIKALNQSVHDLATEIKVDEDRRRLAIDRLLRFTGTALIDITDDALAGIGRGEMAVTPAVELARRIGSTLERVVFDDAAWTATQGAIHNHIQNLTTSLQSHDYRPETRIDDDTLVVTAPMHGVQRHMRDFSAVLAEEIINRRSLLSAKELELLENYLIQDVAVEMGKLIREAEEFVAGMNRQLASRPNSTGMMLRFHWEPDADGPVAFTDARKKLLGDHATWSPADRTALGQFLQEQINRARDADAASTWQEQLSIALDYRRWHQFHVERRLDNKWVRLTRKTHGTGSGGEKAIALTIPQFAAAAAYYDSAAGYAPRLILLDEAFVGIDSDMRGKCMGLLHEFDLDFVMTSEREWGCYRSMPGLAIYQLSARADIDALWASRWVWNGRERVLQNPDLANRVSAPQADRGLFGSGATEDPS